MNPQILGCMLINETSSDPNFKTQILSNDNNSVSVRVNLQDCDELNRNIRKYPFPIIQRGLDGDERIQELIRAKSWVGEAGHPLMQENPKLNLARQQKIIDNNISHRILSYEYNGHKINGIIRTAPSPMGKMMRDFILDKEPMLTAYSLRALGKIRVENGVKVVCDPFRIITYDWVFYPSHREAYQTSIVEGTEITSSIDDQILSSNLMNEDYTSLVDINESALQYVKDKSSFYKSLGNYVDLSKYKASFSNTKNEGLLLEATEEHSPSFIINTEKSISREINDFLSKF